MKTLEEQQVELEREAYDTSMDRYDRRVEALIRTGTYGDSKEAIIVIKTAIDILAEHINDFYKLKLRGNNGQAQLYMYELLSNPRECALLIIRSIINPLVRGEQKILMVARNIESSLKVAKGVRQLHKEAANLGSYIERRYKHLGAGEVNKALIKASRRTTGGVPLKGLSVGALCIDLVDKSGCGLVEITQRGTTIYIDLSKSTKALLLRSKMFFGSMLACYYPLIVPPKDWEGLQGSGGYYSYKDIHFIKSKTHFDRKALDLLDINVDRLQGVINKVQKQPYRVNRRVLNVVDTIARLNLVDVRSSPNNPVLYGNIPFMEAINSKLLIVKSDYGALDDNNKFIDDTNKNRFFRAVKEQEIRAKAIESKRIQFRLALDIAHKFKRYDKIYFTYQLDFRGRLYPLQQHFHPQSSDNVRPLLEFAEGAPLTERGLYWLLVHGANCYGYDKLPYAKRVAKMEQMKENIKKVAKDPTDNIKYWYEADAPLAFLAFCFAYGDYLKDPTVGITLPVQLDATCSGLQIYAGLLKDKSSALRVNVINNGDVVNDVYKDVADKVNGYLERGEFPEELRYKTKDGSHRALTTHKEALSIKGKITRKLTKRNVMTQPYSVTDRGMFEQVNDLLVEHQDNNTVFWEGDKYVTAKLIAELNAKAINELVRGAKVGQRTVKALLRSCLQTEKQALWYTPFFNFPVLQRIMREKEERLRTPLGRLVLRHPTKQVHHMRMLNGIAPNFIHSLDATLLYRTVELCQEAGVHSFWLIHDSYGTLPNDIDTLNVSFRQAYVQLFEANPLEDFAEQIAKQGAVAKEYMINTLDLQDVLKSDYIIC